MPNKLLEQLRRLEEIINTGGVWSQHDLAEWLRLDLPNAISLAETMQQEYAEMDEKMVYAAELEQAAGETNRGGGLDVG
ncbi:hypothetical protein MO973_19680 [Paenibacillus sp. TRM 82003]|nr:hypothetical protein [Paenibacillus sp. TRM 82003]